jgi:two-component system, cell cycle sensor histidine kinase and response regulator CckA
MSIHQILVVEDDRLIANGIQSDLERLGYHVSGIAISADDSITMAIQQRPDLVLMDIHLNGERNGVDAAREIFKSCGIPSVYLSTSADAETLATAKGMEAVGCLLMPYAEWELPTTIEMAIEKHHAAQRFAEAERWLAAILEGIDEAVIAMDEQNTIHFINRAGCAMTGCSQGDAAGTAFATVCELNGPEGPIELDELSNQAVRERCSVELPASTCLVDKNGSEIFVEGSFCPIYDQAGKSLGTVLTLRSVNTRVERERIRGLGEEHSRNLQKMEALRRVAGGVGHHLNDLVSVILGNTSLALAQSSADDKITEALERVDAASHGAAEQIERLVRFSGRGHRQLPQVDLNQVLSECLDEVTPLLASEIYVSFQPESDLWPVILDEVQVDQLLLNLCLNSQNAMPSGGQLVLESKNVALTNEDLTQHPDGRIGDFVRIRIRADGQGRVPEMPTRNGVQQHPTREQRQGVELGIAFAAAVMEQHHGWVECQKDAGAGSWFDLYFPRFRKEAVEQAAIPGKPHGAKAKILLAESDGALRRFGQLVLEEEGYQVVVAEDGVQAVKAFQQSPEQIDLVIIDLNLPRLTGDAVLKRFLELDPNVEVLFSSGYFAADHHEGGSHMAGIIRKPYSRQKLIESVQHALVRRSESIFHHGRIAKICQSNGPNPVCRDHGFISTCDGREVYFDAESLVDIEFQQLEIQSEVQFIETEEGGTPRASSVRLSGQHQHLVV